jgi:hypothetical protein
MFSNGCKDNQIHFMGPEISTSLWVILWGQVAHNAHEILRHAAFQNFVWKIVRTSCLVSSGSLFSDFTGWRRTRKVKQPQDFFR